MQQSTPKVKLEQRSPSVDSQLLESLVRRPMSDEKFQAPVKVEEPPADWRNDVEVVPPTPCPLLPTPFPHDVVSWKLSSFVRSAVSKGNFPNRLSKAACHRIALGKSKASVDKDSDENTKQAQQLMQSDEMFDNLEQV